MKKLLISVSVLALALALASPVVSSAQSGGDLFKAKCAMCHGADGSGNTAMGKNFGLKDLGSADVQGKSDADLTTIVTKGKGKMPAYDGKLTKDQITDVVKYIRTLKK
jgi:mono/diheme cytochrome c family protein